MTEGEFIEKISAHKGIINKLLYLYVDDAEDKQDLYQEIVLQTWKALEKFRGDAQFSTWLYRISLNTILTYVKRKNRFQKEELHEEVQTKNPELSDKAVKLLAAIKILNDIDKSLITLHFDGYRNEEIAQILGISKGNVGVKLHRIKEQLKNKLHSNG